LLPKSPKQKKQYLRQKISRFNLHVKNPMVV
jgi:hypothetical protein